MLCIFFPKCITLNSLILKFNCNLITLSFSIVSSFCESSKSAQNWLFWKGFCYLFLSLNHLWICWAEQTLGWFLEGLPWNFTSLSLSISSFLLFLFFFLYFNVCINVWGYICCVGLSMPVAHYVISHLYSHAPPPDEVFSHKVRPSLLITQQWAGTRPVELKQCSKPRNPTDKGSCGAFPSSALEEKNNSSYLTKCSKLHQEKARGEQQTWLPINWTWQVFPWGIRLAVP